MEKGAGGCAEGFEIKTEAECIEAIESLKKIATPMWTGSESEIPKYCSSRDYPGPQGNYGHFNSANSGVGRSDLQPVCKSQRNILV